MFDTTVKSCLIIVFDDDPQILGPGSGWQPIPLTEVITSVAVKKAYRKATLCVHPDKLQQRGASIQQKYICEKVFDLLKVWFSYLFYFSPSYPIFICPE